MLNGIEILMCSTRNEEILKDIKRSKYEPESRCFSKGNNIKKFPSPFLDDSDEAAIVPEEE